jgi:hypothetical protein
MCFCMFLVGLFYTSETKGRRDRIARRLGIDKTAEAIGHIELDGSSEEVSA